MKTAYLFAIGYFGLMALLLLGSGIWIFVEKIGLNIHDIITYYSGNASLGVPAKSLYGQLEIAVPHLGAMGLFVMVTMHFLLFAPKKRKKHLIFVAIVTFLAVSLNIVSGIMISQGVQWFAYIKLIAFLLFSLFSFYIVILVLFESLRTLHHQRYI